MLFITYYDNATYEDITDIDNVNITEDSVLGYQMVGESVSACLKDGTWSRSGLIPAFNNEKPFQLLPWLLWSL